MADEATPIETSETVTEIPANEAAPAVTETALAGADADTAEVTDTAEDGETSDTAVEVPEAYELTFSEGIAPDDATIAEATPLLQELKLSNEQAQKFVPLIEAHTARALAARDAQIDSYIAGERAAWLESAKADPEIGGDKFDASLTSAAKALDRFGATKDSDFRALLETSGLGNHPEMIRMFAKIGAAVSEDTSFPRSGSATQAPRTLAETLYPSS